MYIHFHIIGMFPRSIESYLKESIVGRAQKSGAIEVSYYSLLDYAENSVEGTLPQRVDAKPYGGGPGMVLKAKPVMDAIADAVGRKKNVTYMHFAPRAERFTNQMARDIKEQSLQKKGAIRDVVIICGRYEGVDSRINEMYPGITVSIGDYVLSGGELAAAVVVDTVTRQLPGVLGDADSLEEDRKDASSKYYANPECVTYKKKKYCVPEVLRSGNHAEIERWRQQHN